MNMLCSRLSGTGLLSVDKHKLLAVFAKNGDWVPDCIKELEQECFIPIKDMDSWRVCIECARKDSTHSGLGLPGAHAIEAAAVDPEVESAVSKRVKTNEGLNLFLLHHKAGNGDAMKGFDLFVEHVAPTALTSSHPTTGPRVSLRRFCGTMWK